MWPFGKKPKKSQETMAQNEFDDLDSYYNPQPPAIDFGKPFRWLRRKLGGLKGDVGMPGMQGPMGAMGMRGERGMSDYELAQSVGFEGTLLEWLDPDIKKAFLLEKMNVEASGTITAVENK